MTKIDVQQQQQQQQQQQRTLKKRQVYNKAFFISLRNEIKLYIKRQKSEMKDLNLKKIKGLIELTTTPDEEKEEEGEKVSN